MEKMLIYPVGGTKACTYASQFLSQMGFQLTDHPEPEITHLLLDVPSFREDRKLRCGGELKEILRMLPHDITIVGGNLSHPDLDGYNVLDLLQNETYLARNAAITAECAVQVAAAHMESVFFHTSILILGWGRIGKCLGKILHSLGGDVTIFAKKESDRAILRAMGYQTVDVAQLHTLLPNYKLIFNTVPSMLIPKEAAQKCKDSLFIELASKPGIDCNDVISARGLPGVYAPESSGKLIAEIILSQYREV